MNKQILVIEDDAFIGELLVEMMTKSGFTVFYAVDAEDGEKLLQSNTPDIILLDLILPGMDGFEFLERIKKDERLKNISVIILSNLGSEDDVKKGLQLGADAYFVKANFIMEDIVEKVEEVLQKRSFPKGRVK